MASTSWITEPVTVGAAVALRDGSRVRVRQLHRADRELLVRGFERLGPEARYQRFLTPMPRLPAGMVRYLTEIDHHHHEAIITLDEVTGEAVGVGRYLRDATRPDVAEVAVTVIDDWQDRGLGTLLLDLIGGRAREEGITRFRALMLATAPSEPCQPHAQVAERVIRNGFPGHTDAGYRHLDLDPAGLPIDAPRWGEAPEEIVNWAEK